MASTGFRRAHLAVPGALALAVTTLAPLSPVHAAPPSSAITAANLDEVLGDNVTVFSPDMPVADIQQRLDAEWAAQKDNEMGTRRHAFYFLPGTYGTDAQPLNVKVGYQTEVAGLGQVPGDVVVNGSVEVYNRCLAEGGTANCIALNNFWRTVSNLTIDFNPTGKDGCRATANFWAVSQAVSLRRIAMSEDTLSLMDYCTAGPQFASGGFIADSALPAVTNGSQQQWFIRNSSVKSWSNGVWNQVFSGVEGAPSERGFPTPPYTVLDTTPLSREKPFLYVDDEGVVQVRIPSAETNSSGVSWADGLTAGRSVPLSQFTIATPRTSFGTLNSSLAAARDIFFTPGVYEVSKTLTVKRADTVVLGSGQATLTSAGGATPMRVNDVPGVVLAGLTFDAGPTESKSLLEVGREQGHGASDPANPTTLSDVYFRVGGPHVGRTGTALVVNSAHVLVDHAWVWRADHGIEGFTEGVNGDTDRWRTNTAHTGMVVNGDDVTATGLFVEHFQGHNVVWNGERGTTVLFQSELAYDAPTQAEWTQPDGTLGWESYVVADDVREHELYGGGAYVFQQNNPSIHTENGFRVPQAPGVQLHHLLTVNLDAGTIDHVVNGTGDPVTPAAPGVPSYVEHYPTR